MRKALTLRVAAVSLAGVTAVGVVAGCSSSSSSSGRGEARRATVDRVRRPTGRRRRPVDVRPTARPTGCRLDFSGKADRSGPTVRRLWRNGGRGAGLHFGGARLADSQPRPASTRIHG
jgi:hypothetical protein